LPPRRAWNGLSDNRQIRLKGWKIRMVRRLSAR
jgi:hypothetical protein